MLHIEFKRYKLEHFEACGVESGTNDRLYSECFSEDQCSGDNEGGEYDCDTYRKVQTAQLVDDDGDTRRAVVYRVIRDEYADNRKAGHQRSDRNH